MKTRVRSNQGMCYDKSTFGFKGSSWLSLTYFLRQGDPEPWSSYFKSSLKPCCIPLLLLCSYSILMSRQRARWWKHLWKASGLLFQGWANIMKLNMNFTFILSHHDLMKWVLFFHQMLELRFPSKNVTTACCMLCYGATFCPDLDCIDLP